jgi:hypothetical protein
MVTYTQGYVERCLRQHTNHSTKLPNGDCLISMPGGLYDLFVGQGWSVPARIRLIHLRSNNSYQITQLSGPTLSREYRTYLHRELA